MDSNVSAPPKYACAQCGRAVLVLDSVPPVRGCNCDGAILANMRAHIDFDFSEASSKLLQGWLQRRP